MVLSSVPVFKTREPGPFLVKNYPSFSLQPPHFSGKYFSIRLELAESNNSLNSPQCYPQLVALRAVGPCDVGRALMARVLMNRALMNRASISFEIRSSETREQRT